MHANNSRGILHKGLIVLPLMVALIGSSANVVRATPSADILFEQPLMNGIAGRLYVPLATHTVPPAGVFGLTLWQVDRYTSNEQLVPTALDGGARTGFTSSVPLSSQLGFQDKPGTSIAQMDGDIVGAYINSKDLPSAQPFQKMMITPEYKWIPGAEPVPFASATAVLSSSMDLQVPVAAGDDTYIVADFLFIHPNGVHISYGIKIFHNRHAPREVGFGYDAPSNGYMLNSPLGIDQRFVTLGESSASATGAPWLGWRHFEWSISQSQFAAALQYLHAQFPAKVQSVDPTQYVLAKVHLNAEFHYLNAPAELGWSMRGWKIWKTE